MSKEIGKVKCRVCDNEDKGVCKVKQCTVKTNKARHCQAFIMNDSKIKVSVKPNSVMRPDWYWNRKEIIKQLKVEEQKAKAQEMEKPAVVATLGHDYLEGEKPDVLSKFRSSATKEKE